MVFFFCPQGLCAVRPKPPLEQPADEESEQYACEGGIGKARVQGIFSLGGRRLVAWMLVVLGMISGTLHDARAMTALIGHDPIKLRMHQLQLRHNSTNQRRDVPS
jgi:hypothetical protein